MNEDLLETRHDEYLDEARELLKRLAAQIEKEAAATDYHWGDVGSIMALVDDLRDLGPYWVGDKANDTF